MAKKNKKRTDIVYSTNPDYDYSSDYEGNEDTLEAAEQNLRVMIDRKKRKGKEVTLITGFVGADEDLKELGRLIKQKCGVGGSTKDGEIIIQGNQIAKVMDYLIAKNYKVKKSGGN
jgi:translation initiation factor 1